MNETTSTDEVAGVKPISEKAKAQKKRRDEEKKLAERHAQLRQQVQEKLMGDGTIAERIASLNDDELHFATSRIGGATGIQTSEMLQREVLARWWKLVESNRVMKTVRGNGRVGQVVDNTKAKPVLLVNGTPVEMGG